MKIILQMSGDDHANSVTAITEEKNFGGSEAKVRDLVP